jgi:thiol-disulfide isomerase/thioredoxin
LAQLGAYGQPPSTEPRIVKFDELKKAITEQKGKVVVVDLWSDTCTICKEEFPRLVQLHEKHAKDGLAAMSVSLDRPTNEKAMKNVRAFLKEKRAYFANFVVNEEPDVWQERFGIDGPPVVFVFGRDGKLVKKYDPVDNDDNSTIYDKLEKLLPELLRQR